MSATSTSSSTRANLADRSRGPMFAVLAVASVYAVVLCSAAIAHHGALHTQMNDLGNAIQALWLAGHGELRMPASNSAMEPLPSRLAVHANLIFFPVSLLYRMWPSPMLLFGLTTLACVAAGLGLWMLARELLGPGWWSVVLPIAFWVNPMTHDANLYDFHVVTLEAAFLAWMFWGFATGRVRLGWVMLVLSLLCKEDVAPVVGLYALFLWQRGSRRLALQVAIVSIAYATLVFWVLVPLANGGRAFVGPDDRYAWLEQLWHQGAWSDLAAQIGAKLVRFDRLRLFFYLLLIGAGVAMRAWRLLLMTLPMLIVATMTHWAPMTRISGTYYWIVPELIILVACLWAAVDRPQTGRRMRRLCLTWPLGASVCASVLLSPLPYSLGVSMANYQTDVNPVVLQRMLERIPADAAVCVQNNLGPRLAERHNIATLATGCHSPEVQLLHLRWVGGPHYGITAKTISWMLFGGPPESLLAHARRLATDDSWGLTAYEAGFYLFVRGAVPAYGREEVTRFVQQDTTRLGQDMMEAMRPLNKRLARILNGYCSWSDLLAD